jgi:hypothetical protein
MLNLNELLPYIDQIISTTEKGEMNWQRLNPTTFVWNAAPPNAGRIVLQQVITAEPMPVPRVPVQFRQTLRQVTKILFQVIDDKNVQRISISSTDDEALRVRLDKLYQTLSSGITSAGLDFLKSILPGSGQ